METKNTSLFMLVLFGFLFIPKAYSNDTIQMIHPVEKIFRDIINNDTLLHQKYLQTKSYISKIVDQKIAEANR